MDEEKCLFLRYAQNLLLKYFLNKSQLDLDLLIYAVIV